jgi:DNA (cytosine-5)-methyltransferase 1
VFVVGYLGDWRPAAAILFESESLQRDSKQSRAKRQETPTDAQGSVGTTGFAGNVESQVAACLQTTCDDYSRADGFNTVIEQVAQPIAYSFDSLASNSMKSSNPNSGCREVETSKTIDTTTPEPSKNQGGIAIAQPIAVDCFNQTINEKTTQTIGSSASDVNHYGAVLEPKAVDFRNSKIDGDVTMTLQSKPNGGYSVNYQPGVLQTMAIRRLTPVECEKLQGFPPNWTKIPYRNKPADQCPDGPRYKACGNSMAVPVMRWIGQRIEYVESLMKDL